MKIKNLIFAAVVGLLACSAFAGAQAQAPPSANELKTIGDVRLLNYVPPDGANVLFTKMQDQAPPDVGIGDFLRPIPTVVYTFRHGKFFGVGLTKFGEIRKVPFVDHLDWNAFAGSNTSGVPGGGVAITAQKQIVNHVYGMAGLGALIQQKQPVDIAFLAAVIFK